MENIDVTFAESRGIKCFRSPEGNRDAVAEHCLAMLLSLFNNVLKADAEVRKGIWQRTENWGVELKGKTIGILGYGFMGEAFVKRLAGFNVKVLTYDKYKSNYISASNYIQESNLETIYEEADIVSLHLPLTAETNQLFNSSFINRFKKNIYLLNTARGGIVSLRCDVLHSLARGKYV